MRSPIAALTLSLAIPSVALADLILVEDHRFVETNVDGVVVRDEPPSSLAWEWTAEMPQYPVMSQVTTFDGTTLSGSGGAFITLDSAIAQDVTSTFDVLFRVDRPTLISLSGEFLEYFGYAPDYAGRLLFMENDVVLLNELSLTEPAPPYTRPLSFALEKTLVPEATYRLLLKAAAQENSTTGATDVYQNWSFTLEVPEPTTAALLSLSLAAALLRRRR